MTVNITSDIKIKFRLATGNGNPESLSNVLTNSEYTKELRKIVNGVAWNAEGVADVLNRHNNMFYIRKWEGVLTTPRKLMLEGKDVFGNTHTLYVLSPDENMYHDFNLRIALTNENRVPLSLSNIVNTFKTTPIKGLVRPLYEAAQDWSAENLADAINEAARTKHIFDRNWRPVFESPEKCKLVGTDYCGNEHILIVSKY